MLDNKGNLPIWPVGRIVSLEYSFTLFGVSMFVKVDGLTPVGRKTKEEVTVMMNGFHLASKLKDLRIGEFKFSLSIAWMSNYLKISSLEIDEDAYIDPDFIETDLAIMVPFKHTVELPDLKPKDTIPLFHTRDHLKDDHILIQEDTEFTFAKLDRLDYLALRSESGVCRNSIPKNGDSTLSLYAKRSHMVDYVGRPNLEKRVNSHAG